jgi:peptide/nickel transport system substrate-binding protein
MNKRSLLIPATVLLMAAACAAPTNPQPAQPGIVKEAEAPAQSGGIFQLAVLTSPVSVFPYSDTTIPNNVTSAALYETLVKYDYAGDYRDEYKLQPMLAEKWERADPTTYVFHLRQGVKFHDGSPLTAADVVWSLEYLRDPANKFRRAVELDTTDKIEMPDQYTVRMTSKGPAPSFLSSFTNYTFILSKTAFDRGVNLEKEAIGTGPFKAASWDPRSGASLVKNTAYWSPGRPYLDKVQLFYNFDASSAIAAFAAGKTDVVKVSDKVQFDAVTASSPGARGESFPQNISDHVILKSDAPPFNDARVRKAMHLALDRQEMVSTLTFGFGNPNPPAMNGARKGGWAISQEELANLPGYRQPKDQDVAEAKRLLAEAGYGGGLKATLTYNTGFTRYPGEAEMVTAQLSKVGVQLSLDPKEAAVARQIELEGSYQMNFAQFDYDPEPDWSYWLSKQRSGNTDADLAKMIEEQNRELDEGKRKQQWVGLQRLLLDRLYVIPLVTQVGFIAYQPYVHGWGDNRAGQAVNQAWDSTWVEPAKVPAGR